MLRKFILYLSMVIIMTIGYIQDRYDVFIFGFITLTWIMIDLELIQRMDSYFTLKVRSNASRAIMSLLLIFTVLNALQVTNFTGATVNTIFLTIYGGSVLAYVTSVLIFYMSYK